MVKFIQKNGNYFLRKPYDFALHPEGAELLFSQNINLNQCFDDEYFKILCNKDYVAIFQEDVTRNSIESNQETEQSGLAEHSSDSLQDLMDSIRKIEQRFSDYGIEIEVRVKPSSSH